MKFKHLIISNNLENKALIKIIHDLCNTKFHAICFKMLFTKTFWHLLMLNYGESYILMSIIRIFLKIIIVKKIVSKTKYSKTKKFNAIKIYSKCRFN